MGVDDPVHLDLALVAEAFHGEHRTGGLLLHHGGASADAADLGGQVQPLEDLVEAASQPVHGLALLLEGGLEGLVVGDAVCALR
ncbi:hypothetical protein [Nesterenkonia pannonica]|uniref:hypothetical protein n=1 Tax=Nesterenkonia pannonica TaxID=1548602 RepID=UPI00216480CF|nr:hypothetical protein [Nesterenkonia pannonica]